MLRFMEKHFGGHVTLGPLTLYGFNAMHLAVNLSTRWWGTLCFHPGWGGWPWSLYLSPNGTPWAATWARGPGLYREEILLAPVRRALFGHNFDTNLLRDYEPYHQIKADAEASAQLLRVTWSGGLRRRGSAAKEELAAT